MQLIGTKNVYLQLLAKGFREERAECSDHHCFYLSIMIPGTFLGTL